MTLAGTIKIVTTETGSGVLEPDDGSPDVTVSIEAVRAAGIIELIVGQRLSYEVEQQEDGSFVASSLIADE